jgi:hypothetical protein
VLEALMRAAQAALSAEDLLEQVWDENADPFTKTVQVTMGRLRRKLGEPQVIETLPSLWPLCHQPHQRAPSQSARCHALDLSFLRANYEKGRSAAEVENSWTKKSAVAR